MIFSTKVTYRTRAEENLNLCTVWEISERELALLGQESLSILQSDKILSRQSKHVAWGCQAIVEYQDLQSIQLPNKGSFLNINYLFFQGINILRESIIAGLNGLYHTSLASLRSALEHFVFDIWWKIRLNNSDDFREFYDWLSGKKQTVTFTQALADIFKVLNLPTQSCTFSDCRKIYKCLCSYSHKPLIDESIMILKGSNMPVISNTILKYWIELLELTLAPILDISIAYKPQSLFPCCVYKKFGFNSPVGVFFDQSNFIPLREWLGSKCTNSYIIHYRGQKHLNELINWYNNHKDMTDKEILKSWDDANNPDDYDMPIEERILIRWTSMKADMRLLSIAFAFGIQKHSIVLKDKEAIVNYWKWAPINSIKK